jgi:hypothetical protein
MSQHRTPHDNVFQLPGGWATLTGKYNAGVSLNRDRKQLGFSGPPSAALAFLPLATFADRPMLAL